MSASALPSIVLRGLAICGAAAGGGAILTAALGASGAQAQANRCAIYGAGFVAVNGTDTCVRIGGRVRVDGVVAPAQNLYGSSELNFAPGANSSLDGAGRAHLRLQNGLSGGMPRTR